MATGLDTLFNCRSKFIIQYTFKLKIFDGRGAFAFMVSQARPSLEWFVTISTRVESSVLYVDTLNVLHYMTLFCDDVIFLLRFLKLF